MTHTPGPWKIVTVDGQNTGSIFSGKIRVCAKVGEDVKLQKTADADIALIAAAPELLEALQEVVNSNPVLVATNPNCLRYVAAIEKARAAIKKARGEE